VCRITARRRQERGYALTVGLDELRVAFDRNLGIDDARPAGSRSRSERRGVCRHHAADAVSAPAAADGG
jgi:hypothetical protein